MIKNLKNYFELKIEITTNKLQKGLYVNENVQIRRSSRIKICWLYFIISVNIVQLMIK